MFVTGGLISPYAQQEASWMGYPSKTAHTKGQIHYQEDSRTSQLIEFLSLPQPPDNTVLMDGYRVQIYFNSDKQLIDEQRTKFSQTYPSIRAYIRYEAPNYSIKVGNFYTELQAESFRAQISYEFPTSIIQEDRIELPSNEENAAAYVVKEN